MGIETIAFAAFNAVRMVSGAISSRNQIKAISRQQQEIARVAQENAQAQSDALRKEGTLAAQNKAQEVARKAARQRVSFLSAGLTMEGTPESVIGAGLATGKEDIDQIAQNYAARANNAAMNIVGQARLQNMSLQQNAMGIAAENRSNMLSSLGSMGQAGFEMGTDAGFWGGTSPTTGINWNSGRV